MVFSLYNPKVSLIGRQWALTAAHCCAGNILFKTVRFGSTSQFGGGTTRTVQNAFVHPEFHSETYAHDICILQLDDDVVYDENIKPICLETAQIPPSTSDKISSGFIAGWGRTDLGETGSYRVVI